MSGNINDIAYQGMKQVENIYATADGDKSGTIDLNEAKKTDAGSVFDQMANELIKEGIDNFNTQNKNIDISLVKKYIGNNSIDNGIKSLFNVISYNKGNVQDGENANSVREKINEDINNQISSQIINIQGELKNKYGEAVQKAVAQAAKQQFGLMNDNEYDKDKDGSVSTYNSASLGKKEKGNATEGYKATADSLKNAKTFQREVNGEMQTIYVFHENGKKRRVVIDDAGQMHDLKTVSGGGSLEKNTYITEDAYQLAQEQSGVNDKKFKIQRAKVDGKYENTYKDSEGNVHKIDHNNANGENYTVDVKKISKGGKKKFGTDTSGYAVSGETSRTQRGRNKIDAANIEKAINGLKPQIEKFGGRIGFFNSKSGEQMAVVTLNGHTYNLTLSDNKGTDDTLSAIKSELDTLSKVKSGDTTINNAIIEDTRTDAGDWGVDGNHKSKSTNINTISYQKGSFTRANFQKEGWKASPGRKREAEILKKMDENALAAGEVHTRNIDSALTFAQRFLKVAGKEGQHYDQLKLANALKIANPSIFDNEGFMKKNVDFNRINLPQDLSRYED